LTTKHEPGDTRCSFDCWAAPRTPASILTHRSWSLHAA
jgi:hypothetical protein